MVLLDGGVAMDVMAWGLLAGGLLSAWLTWRLSRRLAERQDRLAALEHALADHLADESAARIRQAALLEQQEIVEKSVDVGANSAELVHKAVAGVTFGILDAIPVTKGVSRFVRSIHDGIADTIYATVRTSNREIGGLAKELLKAKGELDTARRRDRDRGGKRAKASDGRQRRRDEGVDDAGQDRE